MGNRIVTVNIFDNAAVTMSVYPIHWQQQRRAAGLLLGAPRAGDIDL